MKNRMKKIILFTLAFCIALQTSPIYSFAEEVFEEEELQQQETQQEATGDELQEEAVTDDTVAGEGEVTDATAPSEPGPEIEPEPEISVTEYTDSDYKKSVLLEALDIVNGLPAADGIITRGEYAAYLYALSGSPMRNSENLTYFYDVDSNTPNGTEINAIYTMGIMNGVADKIFAPENAISYNDALVGLVRVLGYEPMAKRNGGYLGGYAYTATRLKLHGAGQTADGMLTGKALVNLLYEALFCYILEDAAYSGEDITYLTGNQTLLESRFGYREYRGQLVADEFVSIGGRSTVSEGTAVIKYEGKDYLYTLIDLDAYEFVGKNILYYANTDGEIICMRETNNQEELLLDGDDIEYVSGNLDEIIYYSSESGKQAAASIDRYADFVYNGRTYFEITAADIQNTNGTVRLLDYDEDSAYDCVFVLDYEYYLADGITSDGVLRDKRPDMSFDFHTDDEDYHTTVYKYGIETSLSMINPYDVVAVASSRNASGPVRIIAAVTDDVLEGTVTAIGDEIITVNGVDYEYTKDFPLGSVYLNDSAIFGINESGRLCLYKKTYSDRRSYIYVTGFEMKSSISTKCRIRALNDSGDFVIYEFADKFKVNAASADAQDVQTNLYLYGELKAQLAAVVLNDEGLIKEIQFADPDTPTGPVHEGSKETLTLNKTYNGQRYRGNYGIINAEYYTTDDTRKFIVFTDDEGEIAEDFSSYGTKNFKTFTTGSRPPMMVYDALDTDRVARAVVFKMSVSSYASYYPMDVQAFVVDKVFNRRNADGDFVLAASGYQSGSAVVYEAEPDAYDMSTWKKGDVYRTYKSINGKIANAYKMYSMTTDSSVTTAMYGDKTYTAESPAVLNISESGDNTCMVALAYGNFRNIDSEVSAVYITVDGSEEIRTYKYDTSSGFYKYDTASGEYSAVTSADVASGTGKAFVYSRYGIVRDLVIIE